MLLNSKNKSLLGFRLEERKQFQGRIVAMVYCEQRRNNAFVAKLKMKIRNNHIFFVVLNSERRKKTIKSID